jgi:propionyl-CoA carboxylase alpha chain
MGEQAVLLAKAVGYFSAGTVEFIVDGNRNFYFLEMNTRLQVEHPVTELITGIDLVEQMIRIAAGEKLAFGQDEVKLEGWAIESRLYAEDPYRNFLPSIGRLSRYRPPLEGVKQDGTIVRNDTGVFEGGEISMYYDPMVAKLCTWAKDRTAAIDAMATALDGFEVEGIGHNLPFLSAVMNQERFRSGNLTTAYIAEEFPDGFSGVHPDADALRILAAIAAFAHQKIRQRAIQISGTLSSSSRGTGKDWIVSLADAEEAVTIETGSHESSVVFADGSRFAVSSDWLPGKRLASFTIGDQVAEVKIDLIGSAIRLRWRGMDVRARVRSPRVAQLARLMPIKVPPDMSRMLLCPMPGVITSVTVGVGDQVEAGQTLATVEAMKMENVLKAERRGVVKRVTAVPGQSLAVDELIMEFE